MGDTNRGFREVFDMRERVCGPGMRREEPPRGGGESGGRFSSGPQDPGHHLVPTKVSRGPLQSRVGRSGALSVIVASGPNPLPQPAPVLHQVGVPPGPQTALRRGGGPHTDSSGQPKREKIMEDIKAAPSRDDGLHLPCFPCMVTPGVTVKTEGDTTDYHVTASGRVRTWVQPVLASPVSSSQMRGVARGKSHHSLYLRDSDNVDILQDSGSDGEAAEDGDSDDDLDDDAPDAVNLKKLRKAARRLRSCIVEDQESMDEDNSDCFLSDEDGSEQEITSVDVHVKCERMEVDNKIEWNERVIKEEDSAAASPVDTNFVWSEDFTTFTGQKESYLRIPGPTLSSQDPSDIFSKIWDDEFMETVVKQTNKYACEMISQVTNPDNGTGIPKCLNTWTDVTVEELYRVFSVIILMSFCPRSSVHDYWETGIFGMPAFCEVMSLNRYLLINKFLHFTCNDNLLNRGYDRKVDKVGPVVNHCNRKFAELYTPSQYLSLDESLLLWKGRLSRKPCVRSKDVQMGIKSFEFCEAKAGYLLQYRLYTGLLSGHLHGFKSHTTKVVLDLMKGYLNVGHVVIMDSWYNQLCLMRYLKSQRTDELGTLNSRQKGIPQVTKDMEPNQTELGMAVSRHSGDIALVTWKGVELVTLISTYHHQHGLVPERCAGQVLQKPVAVQEYNRYMGGVDLKDRKLSMFIMERKRNQKWYMKVFRRLLNSIHILHAKSHVPCVHPPPISEESHRRSIEPILARFLWKLQSTAHNGPSSPSTRVALPRPH